MFDRFVVVLYHLAKNPQGLTVGELAGKIHGMSKGRAKRLLDDLKSGRYAEAEMQPHGRTGKRVYALTQRGKNDLRELAELAFGKAV